MSEDINLLDPNKDAGTVVPVKRLRLMRIFAVSLLFLVSAASIILFLLVTLSPLPQLKQQEQDDRQTLARVNADIAKLELLDERTGAVQDILSKRKSFNKNISFIVDKLPPTVAIASIRVDTGTISLTVQSKSLQALDTFLNSMVDAVQQKNGFTKITLTNLLNEETTDAYSMTISLVTL